jgi:hypothetical protein
VPKSPGLESTSEIPGFFPRKSVLASVAAED